MDRQMTRISGKNKGPPYSRSYQLVSGAFFLKYPQIRDGIEVCTLFEPSHGGNNIAVVVLMCASSRKYRSIVLLKNVVFGRKMMRYDWPQVFIKNLLISFIF